MTINEPEKCPSYDHCKAPLCPLDKQSLLKGIWYPDEDICNSRLQKKPWITIQRRIAKKAKNRDRCFTFKDFLVKRVQNPRGHNPDKIIQNAPERGKTQVYTRGEKVKAQKTCFPSCDRSLSRLFLSELLLVSNSNYTQHDYDYIIGFIGGLYGS